MASLIEVPDVLDAPPPVLLPYQQAWIADEAPLKIWEKSRRIGATWAEMADAVLGAAKDGGSNYFYISAGQDMAREAIEAAAMWAKAFSLAASKIGEGIWDEGVDPEAGHRYIKTFEISFPNGRRVVALSSRPANLRGKQGNVGLDEAAFSPDLAALIKAAMAMLMWGNKVRIWSTHNSVENPFNVLVEEVRAGKRGNATVHRVTFAEAVAQGLFRRVCLRKGKAWSQGAEDAWVAEVRAMYNDDAPEELDVIPSQSGGAYLSLALISQRMVPAWSAGNPGGPVLVRGKWDDGFAYLAEDVRRHAVAGWIAEQLAPHLAGLDSERRHFFGQDFARHRDQSVITVLQLGADLVKRVRLVIELANCPFTSQKQIVWHVIDRLPRFVSGAMDAAGNGAALAEETAQRYGVLLVEQVKASDGWYLAHMPKLKADLQDGTLADIPRDEALRDDLRAVRLIQGVPKVPRIDTQSAAAKAAAAEGGDKQRRHGDFAIALLMADYATYREAGEIGYLPLPSKVDAWEGGDDDELFEA